MSCWSLFKYIFKSSFRTWSAILRHSQRIARFSRHARQQHARLHKLLQVAEAESQWYWFSHIGFAPSHSPKWIEELASFFLPKTFSNVTESSIHLPHPVLPATIRTYWGYDTEKCVQNDNLFRFEKIVDVGVMRGSRQSSSLSLNLKTLMQVSKFEILTSINAGFFFFSNISCTAAADATLHDVSQSNKQTRGNSCTFLISSSWFFRYGRGRGAADINVILLF